MWTKIALTLLAAFILTGCGGGSQNCAAPPDQSRRVTIRQGVWGHVWFIQGNCAPTNTCGSCTTAPVRRTVYVYPLTNQSQAMQPRNGFYTTAISVQPVASVQSDDKGFFQIELPPGKYSLLMREGDLLYANMVDLDGNINPVEVTVGTVTKEQFNITYAAAF